MSQGIGEAAVEVALLEVKNRFLTVGNVLGEEIVEVVELQGQEDAATIGKAGCEDQINQEPTETTGFAGSSCRRRGRKLRFCKNKSYQDMGGRPQW